MKASNRRRGATTIEMTLVGIPIIFVLISVFEISRGMWMYNTAATAVREGLRVAAVHGINCIPASGIPNNCPRTANQIVAIIRDGRDAVANLPIGAGAAGLNPSQTTVTFISKTVRFDCLMDGSTLTGGCNDTWPPTAPVGENSIKTPIEIQIRTPFSSAISMFWPGSKPVSFATVNLFASSTDTIQF